MRQHLSAALILVNSAALPHVKSAALCNADMKTVEETRRARLRYLLSESGSLVALNDKLGLNPRDSTLSQILNASIGSKTGQPKTMGSPMARRIETACNKPTGWMDTDPDCDALRWPFDGRVDVSAVASLPAEFFSEAVGALNEVIRRAQAQSWKPETRSG